MTLADEDANIKLFNFLVAVSVDVGDKESADDRLVTTYIFGTV